ncbi:hypothetical protein JOC95_000381 [Bacillus tianshenii]|uniref:Transposase n=1 Tax=Sutcliffiella tianshenii TaxID=1463404 RepID=A0ABS2NV54_9BACI|nr:hypothetical protein [Bacillus tianshenii]
MKIKAKYSTAESQWVFKRNPTRISGKRKRRTVPLLLCFSAYQGSWSQENLEDYYESVFEGLEKYLVS